MKDFEDAFKKRLLSFQENLESYNDKNSKTITSNEWIKKYRILSAAFCHDVNKANELTLFYENKSDQSGKIVSQKLNNILFSEKWDYHTVLNKIKTSSLIIHGHQDPIPLWVAQKIHQKISNSKIVTIDECGHFPYLEQPEAFFKAINNFLN